ncbi:hypothetical protein LAG90_03850 [Marinilongibacter aquaticus]|uniref:hypothetical protein n=1 Tax=Marinilongibacter aquaticus TaxID=2975157 RepID=UPI0021BD83B7|nr:hypothetical protein [Marinilongibacter aquaticus]UBM59780.1 hypothetical protein LAG90_03850 [Marinilongibacter aquaticus]
MHTYKSTDLDRNERKLALEKQVDDFTEKLKSRADRFSNVGKDALIIGGLITLGYVLTKLMDDDDEEPETPAKSDRSESLIFSTLKGVATSVLLAMAKDKLVEYLNSLKEDAND